MTIDAGSTSKSTRQDATTNRADSRAAPRSRSISDGLAPTATGASPSAADGRLTGGDADADRHATEPAAARRVLTVVVTNFLDMLPAPALRPMNRPRPPDAAV
jgi:hypothetical protein